MIINCKIINACKVIFYIALKRKAHQNKLCVQGLLYLLKKKNGTGQQYRVIFMIIIWFLGSLAKYESLAY